METTLWLGSLSSYTEYLARREALNASLLAGSISASAMEDSDPPEHFTLFGNVAVIDVTGTLTNEDSWYSRWCGDTSYNQIRRALFEAYVNPSALAAIINWDTPGGTPNGLSDMGNLIRQFTAMGFPIDGYTGGQATSAGYWGMSACRRLYAGEVATVGSIGVITVHKDYTEMLKQDGIKATVIRSGDKKALGTPVEKLNDTARQSLQEHSDILHRVFSDRVAQYRKLSPEFVWENWADGSTWVGQKAADAGLIDRVTSLDDLIMAVQKEIDKRNQSGKDTNYMANKNTPRLTAQQQAAILAGADVETVLSIEQQHEIETVSDGTRPASEAPAEAPAPTTEAPESDAEPAKAPESELVAFLRTSLSEKDKEILALTTQLNEANTKVAAFQATHEPMKKLVGLSIQKMQIALGGTPMDMSELPAETLLTQHERTLVTFSAKFRVGGVSAVQAEDETTKDAAAVGLNPARLQQNSFSTKK